MDWKVAHTAAMARSGNRAAQQAMPTMVPAGVGLWTATLGSISPLKRANS